MKQLDKGHLASGKESGGQHARAGGTSIEELGGNSKRCLLRR